MPVVLAMTRNSCQQCHQRIVKVGPPTTVFLTALRLHEGAMELRCKCGCWNAAPAHLLVRLRTVLLTEGA
jgi:hypothetical protein